MWLFPLKNQYGLPQPHSVQYLLYIFLRISLLLQSNRKAKRPMLLWVYGINKLVYTYNPSVGAYFLFRIVNSSCLLEWCFNLLFQEQSPLKRPTHMSPLTTPSLPDLSHSIPESAHGKTLLAKGMKYIVFNETRSNLGVWPASSWSLPCQTRYFGHASYHPCWPADQTG